MQWMRLLRTKCILRTQSHKVWAFSAIFDGEAKEPRSAYKVWDQGRHAPQGKETVVGLDEAKDALYSFHAHLVRLEVRSFEAGTNKRPEHAKKAKVIIHANRRRQYINPSHDGSDLLDK